MQLVTAIIALATLPARSEIAAERFHQAQLRAAEPDIAAAASVPGRSGVAAAAEGQEGQGEGALVRRHDRRMSKGSATPAQPLQGCS